MMKALKKHHLFVVLFLFYSFFSIASYWHNLNSFLVFDDISNLSPLESVHTLDDKIRYSFSTIAGYRFLSYASFALQAEAFQKHQYFSVKLTNLFIHVLTAIFVFIFCRRIFNTLELSNKTNVNQSHKTIMALACATLWLAHPIHVNTVLYTVQRMTLLAGLFTLAALSVGACFLQNNKAKPLKHVVLFTITIYSLATLAILAKGTGVLTFAFLLLLLSYTPQARFCNTWLTASFILPLLALLAYLIGANKLGFGHRDFTMAQRLLTEPEIINAYIDKILFSWPSKFSLYYDHYPVVTKLLSARFLLPFTVIVACITLAIAGRKKYPIISFGILFFFIGHLLESTIIPLELYFDHRNYIPSIGIIIALVGATQLALASSKKFIKLFALLLFCAIALNNLASTHIETNSWRNKENFIKSNLNDAPFSLRTWQSLAEYQTNHGNYQGSIETFSYIEKNFGYYVANHIHTLWQQCIIKTDRNVLKQSYQKLLANIPNRKNVKATTPAMEVFLEAIKVGACKRISWEQYRQLLNVFIDTPRYRTETFNAHYLMTNSYLSQQNYEAALQASMQMPNNVLRGNFLIIQLRLAFKTHNYTAAKTLLERVQYLPEIDKITFSKQFTAIAKELERVNFNAQ